MRIGVDATCWANERGYGRYTRELVGALVRLAPDHEFVCFLDERSAGVFALADANVRRAVVAQSVAPTIAAAAGSQRSIRDMLAFSRAVRRAAVDVFYSPSVYGYFPLPPGLPAVVTVHDAIAERFPELTLPSARDRWAWRAKVRLALIQARVILTVSEYAAGELSRHLGLPRERLRVTLEGVSADYRPSESPRDVAAAAERAGVPPGRRWLLYVGGFGPHKHVDRLIAAHGRVAARRPDAPLLLLSGPVGDGFHADVAALKQAVDDAGTGAIVRWLGFCPDAELRHLHTGAVALALVSASEGFGLPAVEAAMCGTPVIATTESPLPQVLDGGGIFVPPGDADAIASAIEQLLDDEPARLAMGARARRRATELSWTRSAGVVLGALVETAHAAEKVRVDAHAR